MRALKLWKPYQVLSKFTDEQGRSTLADYVDVPGVYAAGRLDFDSEGLLLLTDDGALNARLTQPKFGHPRTYLVQVERIPDEKALSQLRAGVTLKDGLTQPAQVEILDAPPALPERSVPVRFRKTVPTAWLKMTLTEGRNRQVRRMTAAVGYPTLRLVRCAIGPVTLAGLTPGTWAWLSERELTGLWQSTYRKQHR